MNTQVNSDKTIAVDASLKRFVEGEVARVLGRFEGKLTRVEVHLSDVDGRKTGQIDKRCLVEVRPAGARPLSASANGVHLKSAIGTALGKARRLLTSFFGRTGVASAVPTVGAKPKKREAKVVAKAKKPGTKKPTVKKTAVKVKKTSAPKKKTRSVSASKLAAGEPPKKRIYQARRKSWPAR